MLKLVTRLALVVSCRQQVRVDERLSWSVFLHGKAAKATSVHVLLIVSMCNLARGLHLLESYAAGKEARHNARMDLAKDRERSLALRPTVVVTGVSSAEGVVRILDLDHTRSDTLAVGIGNSVAGRVEAMVAT